MLQNGLPSRKNCFIFNGDFVDRGYKSVEVLTVILAAFLVYPKYVIVNRGNHEDTAVNQQFGFKKELSWKYRASTQKHAFYNDESSITQLCSNVFRQMPVACIVNGIVFVCHGGIFPSTDLERLRSLDRSKFTSVLSPCLDGPNAVNPHDWQQLLNLLWSDPQLKPGSRLNSYRGGGSYFGPDVTEAFLQRSGFKLIIRSHQCFPEGWQLTHSAQVLTVFSSFDYFGHATNEGVFMRLSVISPKSLHSMKSPGGMILCMKPFQVNRPETTGQSSIHIGNSMRNQLSASMTTKRTRKIILPQLVLLHRCQANAKLNQYAEVREATNAAFLKLWRHLQPREQELTSAFKSMDEQNTGVITISDWCQILATSTHLQLSWRCLRPFLVEKSTEDPSKVHYCSMFNGPCVYHPSLKDHPHLAKDLFINQETLLAIQQLTKDINSVDLISVQEFLTSLPVTPKVEKLKKLLHGLIDLLPKDVLRQFDLQKFLEEFQFVEIRQRINT
ncbi:Serine/threonine-protein phosphatase [Paragonimus heterotremus]|uniref:Serine/threonine-protein phosphatase n=1 Tax=Paragonimus heterotremus TaxID=100268 RepID=A0A8J4T4P7_9TREM|nr:Serine/threonine-protein phosphatase [Paragonimus heterotremus]